MGQIPLHVRYFSYPRASAAASKPTSNQKVRGSHARDGHAHPPHVLFQTSKALTLGPVGISDRGCNCRVFQSLRALGRRQAATLDSNYFEITDVYVRFFLEHRKNAQHNGNFVDIAIPASGARGAYHVIREAYLHFRSGHVLPYIDSSGTVDTSEYMPYDSYVLHLRRALVHIGVPEEQSRRFAGQSARAGAATTAARAGMQPYELCRLAGVTSINWALAYIRPDFNDRMQASRAIGL